MYNKAFLGLLGWSFGKTSVMIQTTWTVVCSHSSRVAENGEYPPKVVEIVLNVHPPTSVERPYERLTVAVYHLETSVEDALGSVVKERIRPAAEGNYRTLEKRRTILLKKLKVNDRESLC